MAGPWKAWKTKGGFSTLPSAPWESRKNREIPTFPQPRRRIPLHPAKAELPEELATLEKWKSKSGIPTFPPSQNRLRRKVKSLKTNTKGESCRFTKCQLSLYSRMELPRYWFFLAFGVLTHSRCKRENQ